MEYIVRVGIYSPVVTTCTVAPAKTFHSAHFTRQSHYLSRMILTKKKIISTNTFNSLITVVNIMRETCCEFDLHRR